MSAPQLNSEEGYRKVHLIRSGTSWPRRPLITTKAENDWIDLEKGRKRFTHGAIASPACELFRKETLITGNTAFFSHYRTMKERW